MKSIPSSVLFILVSISLTTWIQISALQPLRHSFLSYQEAIYSPVLEKEASLNLEGNDNPQNKDSEKVSDEEMQKLINTIVDTDMSCSKITTLIDKMEKALQTIEFEESAMKIVNMIDALSATRKLAKYVKTLVTAKKSDNYTEDIIQYLNSETGLKNFTDIDESIFELKPKLKPFYEGINNKLEQILTYTVDEPDQIAEISIECNELIALIKEFIDILNQELQEFGEDSFIIHKKKHDLILFKEGKCSD